MSMYTGVSVKRNKYAATLTKVGHKFHLGTYDSPSEAYAARQGAEKLIEKLTNPTWQQNAALDEWGRYLQYEKDGAIMQPSEDSWLEKRMASTKTFVRHQAINLQQTYTSIRSKVTR